MATLLREFATRDDVNSIKAECGLGSMAEKGVGMTQDYSEASEWYRKCADGGSWSGQMRLGDLYAIGRGVPKDFVLAYMWLNLASATAPTSLANNIAKQRELLATMMTQEQVAEAQRLSRDWKPH